LLHIIAVDLVVVDGDVDCGEASLFRLMQQRQTVESAGREAKITRGRRRGIDLKDRTVCRKCHL
jgi:hypothetical protein